MVIRLAFNVEAVLNGDQTFEELDYLKSLTAEEAVVHTDESFVQLEVVLIDMSPFKFTSADRFWFSFTDQQMVYLYIKTLCANQLRCCIELKTYC